VNGLYVRAAGAEEIVRPRRLIERFSHRQFKHPTKPGRVTVAGPSDDLVPGTLNSILKQSGLKK